MPQTRCTLVAPTGSSIPIRSKNSTESTTSVPAINPMSAEHWMLVNAAQAVMPTRPARQPLSVMPISGLPRSNQAVIVAESVAAAAAMLVFTATCEANAPPSAATPNVLPGLKPNQPNQSTRQPMKAAIMLCPGRACTFPVDEYLPMRGPRIRAPVRAAQPPTECTAEQPAKSQKFHSLAR